METNREFRVIHFSTPSLYSYKGLYSYNSAWSLCGKYYKSTPNDTNSKNWEDINCSVCITLMTCEHNWKYLYTGLHGSDKGNDYFECKKCRWRIQEKTSWSPKSNNNFVERNWSSFSTKDKKALIMSNFKCYEWNVSDDIKKE